MEQTKSKFRGWEMEDLFQDGNVFVSGINDRPTHMDSYMTVMDFINFQKTWDKIKDKFTREEWLEACDYWSKQGYLSPMASLLSSTIKNKLEINS